MDQERASERAGRISGAVRDSWPSPRRLDFVAPMPALAIGLLAGVVCYLMVTKVKPFFGYDDALECLLRAGSRTLVRCSRGFSQQQAIIRFLRGQSRGWSRWSLGQIGNQLVGVLIDGDLRWPERLVLLKMVDLLTGLRVPEDTRSKDWDVTQHGEEAYNLERRGFQQGSCQARGGAELP